MISIWTFFAKSFYRWSVAQFRSAHHILIRQARTARTARTVDWKQAPLRIGRELRFTGHPSPAASVEIPTFEYPKMVQGNTILRVYTRPRKTAGRHNNDNWLPTLWHTLSYCRIKCLGKI